MPGDVNHPLVLLSGDADRFTGRKTKFKAIFPDIPAENFYFFRWRKVGDDRNLYLYSITPVLSADTFKDQNLVTGTIDFNGRIIINSEGSQTQADDPNTQLYKFKPANYQGNRDHILGDRFFEYLRRRGLLRNGLNITHIDFFACNLGRGPFIGKLREAIDNYNQAAAPNDQITVNANGIRASYFYVNRPQGPVIDFSVDTAQTQKCATTLRPDNPTNWGDYDDALATDQDVVNPAHSLFSNA